MNATTDLFGPLGKAIEAIGDPGAFAALQTLLRAAVPHQMNAAFVYNELDPPVRIYDSEGSKDRDEVHAVLAEIGYLISPYYNGLILTGAPGGFYHIDEVAPDEFRKSEYFDVYYGRKQVCDEGMFLCPVCEGVTFVLMIERHRARPAYTGEELVELRGLYPIVQAVISRHVRLKGLGEILAPENRRPRAKLQDIVDSFGHEMLSPRERDVATLILRGHSSKSAARELGISPETERVHRRRLYSKLGLTSHSELFWLFLQASDHYDANSSSDPLTSFLSANPPGTSRSG